MAWPPTPDVFEDPQSSDPLDDPSHAGLHQGVNHAITAIQSELNVNFMKKFVGSATGEVVWVDSVNGSDSNDGESPGQAKKTFWGAALALPGATVGNVTTKFGVTAPGSPGRGDIYIRAGSQLLVDDDGVSGEYPWWVKGNCRVHGVAPVLASVGGTEVRYVGTAGTATRPKFAIYTGDPGNEQAGWSNGKIEDLYMTQISGVAAGGAMLEHTGGIMLRNPINQSKLRHVRIGNKFKTGGVSSPLDQQEVFSEYGVWVGGDGLYQFPFDATPVGWTGPTAKVVGDRIHVTDNAGKDMFLWCSTAGTTGATQPVWSALTAPYTDGSVVWTVVGDGAPNYCALEQVWVYGSQYPFVVGNGTLGILISHCGVDGVNGLTDAGFVFSMPVEGSYNKKTSNAGQFEMTLIACKQEQQGLNRAGTGFPIPFWFKHQASAQDNFNVQLIGCAAEQAATYDGQNTTDLPAILWENPEPVPNLRVMGGHQTLWRQTFHGPNIPGTPYERDYTWVHKTDPDVLSNIRAPIGRPPIASGHFTGYTATSALVNSDLLTDVNSDLFPDGWSLAGSGATFDEAYPGGADAGSWQWSGTTHSVFQDVAVTEGSVWSWKGYCKTVSGTPVPQLRVTYFDVADVQLGSTVNLNYSSSSGVYQYLEHENLQVPEGCVRLRVTMRAQGGSGTLVAYWKDLGLFNLPFVPNPDPSIWEIQHNLGMVPRSAIVQAGDASMNAFAWNVTDLDRYRIEVTIDDPSPPLTVDFYWTAE